MNKFIKQAVTEALTKSVSEILQEIEDGDFDTIEVSCPCGRSEHGANDKYCRNCGGKLVNEKAAHDGSFE